MEAGLSAALEVVSTGWIQVDLASKAEVSTVEIQVDLILDAEAETSIELIRKGRGVGFVLFAVVFQGLEATGRRQMEPCCCCFG